ncbi:MAG: outer membrane channel protein TolC [Gammaproteobacteria bacterium]|jgi:outer membrane protein|nr:outer membrane channel protein TolC [Gammaproteobacteria bacterium]MBU2181008.1 outer membrane channel protein TolC [Gammaproteobacteria bacterium]MBU2224705.1 outer membrane channel protein TolC [Gammaproteobacteria bacterium]MBU2277875.1 outer membrane channel protein TolC [Gammaproteobacteria bacterium]MBU2427298.1 outer membrane channel protein TolC [Gammaproteobacteria bacterium]
MKKTLLHSLVCAGIGLLSLQASAENLQNVYQLALKKDPLVLRAAAQSNAAKAAIDISKANFLPDISFTSSIGKDRKKVAGTTSPVSTGYSNRISLQQTIFNWADWSNLSTAEKQALQSQTSYNATLQALIVRVSTAYFNVLSADDDLTFVVAEKRAVERQLEQTKQRFAVGLTAITDVHEAQAQYDSVVAREISAINALENAKEALQEITGEYHSKLAPLNTANFSPVAPQPAAVTDWVALAEENNLDLKVRKLALEIAQNDIDVADAGHYPTVSLDASKTLADSRDSFQSDSDSVGVTLRVPIYSGGATSANQEVRRANYVATSEDLELGHRSVLRQTRSFYNNVGAAIAGIKALEQAVISAESALKATEAGFEVGTRTIVDVLISTRNLFDARRNLTKARYDYILAVLSLKQAAGTLTEADLDIVNRSLGA